MFIDGVDFGQTETEAYSEGLEMLDYDSLNIISNLFSIHIFLIALLSQALFSFVLRLSCCGVPTQWKLCTICRKAKESNIGDNIVIGALRLFLTAFLEILICATIGLGIFNLPDGQEMTNVDIVTCAVNIFYILSLILFITIVVWFLFSKSLFLLELKDTRDRLEQLKVLKTI